MDKTHILNNNWILHTSSTQYEEIKKVFQVGGVVIISGQCGGVRAEGGDTQVIEGGRGQKLRV